MHFGIRPLPSSPALSIHTCSHNKNQSSSRDSSRQLGPAGVYFSRLSGILKLPLRSRKE